MFTGGGQNVNFMTRQQLQQTNRFSPYRNMMGTNTQGTYHLL